MELAIVELDFDPVLQVGDVAVLWETVVLAAIFVLALALAALIAGRTPSGELTADPDPGTHDEMAARLTARPPVSDAPEPPAAHLSREHLLYVVAGALPGAVAGGRLGYVLGHLDYYGARPLDAIDFSQGSLELSLAVVGATITGALVARLSRASVGRWLHVAAVPALIAIGLGKLAMALDALGQGATSDLPWATAYRGPGPWGALAPTIPSHPSQIYEGVLTLLAAAIVVAILRAGGFRNRDGGAFFLGLVLWSVVRTAVGVTWRDATVLGPLRTEQLIAIVVGSWALALWRIWAIRAIRGRELRLANGPGRRGYVTRDRPTFDP